MLFFQLEEIEPHSVIRSTFQSTSLFWFVYDISVFISASCPHPCPVVALYALASDVANLLGTNTRWVLFICFHCRVPSGRSLLTSEYHGTAPSACTVLLIVSPLLGDL